MMIPLGDGQTALPGITCASISRWQQPWRDHVRAPTRRATVISACPSAMRCSGGKTLAMGLRSRRSTGVPLRWSTRRRMALPVL
jgi:hypothetical protein